MKTVSEQKPVLAVKALSTRRSTLALLGAAACGGIVPVVFAQTSFATRPLRFIVASSPGGATDTVARRLATEVSKGLGQAVVVENMPQASAVIAAQTVARAAPDGLTVLIGNNTTHAANQALLKNINYDPNADFEPVALLALASLVLGIHPSIPAKNVNELIAFAKANPGKLTYASGTGSARVAAEMFKAEAKLNMLNISYKSNAQAMNDVLGGHTSMIFGDIPLIMQHVRSGAVRGLGVTSARRTALAPELPTIAEAGLPGYELVGFIAAFVPAKTPRAIVQRLSEEFQKPLRDKDFVAGLLAVGVESAPSSPEELRSFVSVQSKKWGDMVRSAGITPE